MNRTWRDRHCSLVHGDHRSDRFTASPKHNSCMCTLTLLLVSKYLAVRLLSFFFFLYIFMRFCVYVPLPPLRGQHMVLCHPRWLPTSGLTEFAVYWGGAGFEPRTTDLQSGALPLSHLSSCTAITDPIASLLHLSTTAACARSPYRWFLSILRFAFCLPLLAAELK